MVNYSFPCWYEWRFKLNWWAMYRVRCVARARRSFHRAQRLAPPCMFINLTILTGIPEASVYVAISTFSCHGTSMCPVKVILLKCSPLMPSLSCTSSLKVMCLCLSQLKIIQIPRKWNEPSIKYQAWGTMLCVIVCLWLTDTISWPKIPLKLILRKQFSSCIRRRQSEIL